MALDRRMSRALITAVAGSGMALMMGSVAYAQYGNPSATTTSSPTTSSSTTSSSTSTSVGSSPGTTIATGSANPEKPSLSNSTTTPGGQETVSINSQNGAVAGANTTTPAPCGAGVPVGIYLQMLQNGQAPAKLASVTSNASGGLDPVSVTIPTSAQDGTYVLFAQCNNTQGVLEILTSPLVLVTTGSAHVAVPNTFTTSSSFGSPQEQAAVNSAVQAQIARAASGGTAAGASGLPNGGLQLVAPRLSLPSNSRSGGSPALFIGVAAAVLALMGIGFGALRRQHRHSQA